MKPKELKQRVLVVTVKFLKEVLHNLKLSPCFIQKEELKLTKVSDSNKFRDRLGCQWPRAQGYHRIPL